ncbi:MAG: hypothetical protein ACR2GO_04250 [Candidatus Limnocylindria bacterium]
MMLRSTFVMGIATVAIGLMLASMALPSPDGSTPSEWVELVDIYFRVAFLVLVTGLAAVGALIAIRRSDHPIGWLFLAAAPLTAISSFGTNLAALVVRGDTELHFSASLIIWLATWAFTPAIAILVFLVPLVFPTGRFLSRRWRRLAWFITLGFALAVVVTAFRAGPSDAAAGLPNPFGIPALTPIFDVIDFLLVVTVLATLAPVIVSIILRYRRAGPVERQQLRWFLYPASLTAASFGAALTNAPLEIVGLISWPTAIGSLALVPLAIGIAILRHRLFEIDRLVSRTLTYSLVTAVLIGVYLGAVVMLQVLLAPVVGDSSPLIVAASTLLVAALVRPVLRRIQAGIDRRFNRSRYNGEVTVRALSGRLRDITDVDRVADVLANSTTEALAPRTVSVWLRPRQADR